MAESDSFIQEVSEEVRRDKMYAVWRRYGPWLIAAIVLAVLLAAGKGWWENRIEMRKAELGGALLEADAIEDSDASAAAFLAVAEQGEYQYPVLARLRAAASLAAAGKIEEAEAQYDAIKAIDGIDPRFRDLAELRTVMLLSERMEPNEMLDRLGPLTVDGSVWRLPALEYEAAAHLKAGAPEQALASLRTLLEMPQLPPAAQGRTGELIEAIEATLDRDDAPAVATPSEETSSEETTPEETGPEAEPAEGTSSEEDAPEETPSEDTTPEETTEESEEADAPATGEDAEASTGEGAEQ